MMMNIAPPAVRTTMMKMICMKIWKEIAIVKGDIMGIRMTIGGTNRAIVAVAATMKM